ANAAMHFHGTCDSAAWVCVHARIARFPAGSSGQQGSGARGGFRISAEAGGFLHFDCSARPADFVSAKTPDAEELGCMAGGGGSDDGGVSGGAFAAGRGTLRESD